MLKIFRVQELESLASRLSLEIGPPIKGLDRVHKEVCVFVRVLRRAVFPKCLETFTGIEALVSYLIFPSGGIRKLKTSNIVTLMHNLWSTWQQQMQNYCICLRYRLIDLPAASTTCSYTKLLQDTGAVRKRPSVRITAASELAGRSHITRKCRMLA